MATAEPSPHAAVICKQFDAGPGEAVPTSADCDRGDLWVGGIQMEATGGFEPPNEGFAVFIR